MQAVDVFLLQKKGDFSQSKISEDVYEELFIDRIAYLPNTKHVYNFVNGLGK